MKYQPLPYPVDSLVPHRPPMLLVQNITERDRINETATVSAIVPETGMWIMDSFRVQPEYFIEVIAQSMAAVSGYDLMCDNLPARDGFLVGVDSFTWYDLPKCGSEIYIRVSKEFEMPPVTVMAGEVRYNGGLAALGRLKVWEVFPDRDKV